MTPDLTPDVRQRLDAHLDAVEQALAASGRSREQRRGIVDDLETQIMDMLAKQSAAPTVVDVETVLARLDPPGAYADVSTPSQSTSAPAVPVPQPTPRYSRIAIWGFVCIVLSLAPLPLLALVSFVKVSAGGTRVSTPLPPQGLQAVPLERSSVTSVPPSSGVPLERPLSPTMTPAGPSAARSLPAPTGRPKELFGILSCMGILLIPLGLVGTILGWVAFAQIRHSKGGLRGIGLALFDGLFYPIIFLFLFMLYFMHF